MIPNVFTDQDFDMWILERGLRVFPDYLDAFFNSAYAGPDENNAGGCSNPDFDAASNELIVETDIGKARDIAFELQRILADEAPYMVLFTTQILEPLRTNVTFGYESLMDGVQNYFQSMNGPLSTTLHNSPQLSTTLHNSPQLSTTLHNGGGIGRGVADRESGSRSQPAPAFFGSVF